ncbi:MAG: hypothetical protein ACYCUX_10415 [Metallibacterium sp.]
MKRIIVSTTNEELADSVFSAKLEGVELSLLMRKSWDPASAERIFYIGVELASSAATNIFASWLWEAIKKYRADKTDIEGTGCPHTEAEIAALVERIVAETKEERPENEQNI